MVKYDLDGFFNEICAKLPELKNEVIKYRQLLKESTINNTVHISKNSLTTDEVEYYKQTIDLVGNSHYTITWNVELAKSVAKKYYPQGSNFEFYTPAIAKAVTIDNLNRAQLNKALSNNKPIIVGYHAATLPPFIIIDGNHRVASRINAGKMQISGYLLKPSMHLECMATKLDQVLYLIHHNFANYIRELNKEPLPNPDFNDGVLNL